jgi:hypothetical protein
VSAPDTRAGRTVHASGRPGRRDPCGEKRERETEDGGDVVQRHRVANTECNFQPGAMVHTCNPGYSWG